MVRLKVKYLTKNVEAKLIPHLNRVILLQLRLVEMLENLQISLVPVHRQRHNVLDEIFLLPCHEHLVLHESIEGFIQVDRFLESLDVAVDCEGFLIHRLKDFGLQQVKRRQDILKAK